MFTSSWSLSGSLRGPTLEYARMVIAGARTATTGRPGLMFGRNCPNTPTMPASMWSPRELVRPLRTVEGSRTSVEDARTQFAIFAFLLAIAILFHQTILGDWEVLSPHLAVSLAAIFV